MTADTPVEKGLYADLGIEIREAAALPASE
jgi:hypothetical protein